ncbi:type III PLP-dependent enzyme [Amycolatopsis mediterranei]|uniref:type III PLP-dependent enzyme n=1 Tax=Amycolatopsis mediterranei TaxID=33910 RepID=UPI003428586A
MARDPLPAGVETPAYLYDVAEVRRCYALLRQALPQPSTVYYAVKANPHPDLLTTLRVAGANAEVCSVGEVDAAIAAGFRPDHLLYTGPGKRSRDIQHALELGVTEFSVDSRHAIDQLAGLAAAADRRVRCLLRVNDDLAVPGPGLVMTGVSSQFGVDLGAVLADPAGFASRPNVEMAGLHLYMGSNIDSEDALVAQFTQAAHTAHRLADALRTRWRVVNLGGGFGAPFARSGVLPRFPGLADRLGATLDEALPGWRDGTPAITFESGRYLAATCGALFTRVLDVKESHGKRVVVLESGVNHLGGMSGLRRLPQIAPDVELAGTPSETVGPAGPAQVSGPLCTPLDLWARGAELPAVRPGDLVRVANVGAYGLSASLVTFLGHPLPTEVVVDGGQIRSSSRLTLTRCPLPASHGGTDG